MSYILAKLFHESGTSVLGILQSQDYPNYNFEVATGFKPNGAPKTKKYKGVHYEGGVYNCVPIFISGKYLLLNSM